jgi:ATP-dependent DNA helicase RecQ
VKENCITVKPTDSSDPLYTESLAFLRRGLNDKAASFRDGQWEAIAGVVERRVKLLVVQRTGWGKSMVYFVATRVLRDRSAGPTILISPLLALMRNQILAAERLQLRAATINSSNPEDWPEVMDRLNRNEVDLLMVSPERLANEIFCRDVLPGLIGRTGLLVIDEAHCISDWGHDFRPDYRRIVKIVKSLPPGIPVLATTATANDRVIEDIVAQLGKELVVSHGHLARDSLRLQVIRLPGQAARMAWLADTLPYLSGSGIVYTLTVRDAKHVAEWLRARGVNAHAYYGELETARREELETQLLENRIKALVATSALGMGYDKPDLTFVIHFQRPASVVHYYQQVGRAGRAVENAYGILLCGEEDDEIAEYFMRTALPPRDHVDMLLSALAVEMDGASMRTLERRLNLSFTQIQKVLTLLAVEEPPVVVKKDTQWILKRRDYLAKSELWDRLLAIRRREQERMQAYMTTRECLMMFLRSELDDPAATPCGKCANCAGKPVLAESYSLEEATAAVQFLRHCEEPIEARKIWPQDALAAYEWKGKIAPELLSEEGRVLCRWGDAGWGEMVARDKILGGKFDKALVDGAAAMIRDRWKPRPFPEWVTCVPSLRRAELVPDFAARLAQKLNLPFVDCVRKTRENPPQKAMQNSYQQSRNLAGVFGVEAAKVRATPVLLVDDMVDSGWTFTVIAALLRQAGSGPVFPLALARSTSK